MSNRPSSIRASIASVAIVAFAGLVAAGCGPFGSDGPDDDTVCVVDGIEVSQEAWDLAMEDSRSSEETRTGTAPKSDSDAGKALRAQVTSSLARWAAFQAEADERDIELGDDAADEAWEEAVERSGGDEKAFVRQLELEGRSEEAVRAELERQLLVSRVVEDARDEAAPSKDDLQAYLEAHAVDFGGTAATRDVVQIIVTAGGPTSKATDIDDAERIATDAAEAAKAGGAAALRAQARKVSDDPTYGPKGGALTYEAGSFSDEISEAVFAADQGDVIGPMRSPIGWHVLVVTGEPTAADVPKLSEVRERVEQAATAAASDEAERSLQESIDERVQDADCRKGYLDAPTPDVAPPADATTAEPGTEPERATPPPGGAPPADAGAPPADQG